MHLRGQLGAAYVRNSLTEGHTGVIKLQRDISDLRPCDNGGALHWGCPVEPLAAWGIHAQASLTNVALQLTQPLAGAAGPHKKRLFLSAKGWQPGSSVLGEGASLLCFCPSGKPGDLPADELPASLLTSGLWSVQAFTPERAQVGGARPG